MSGVARRGVIGFGLVGGFTLATGKLNAAAIHTPADGLVAGPVEIPVADGKLPGYSARPEGAGPFPVVVVIEEIFGVHEYIRDVCRRLAKLGYLAVAPELYARLGDLSTVTDPHELIAKFISRAPDATVLSDLSSTIDWALTQGGDSKRIGTIGFCRGGRDVWLFAEHEPRLKAAVAFYGPVAGPTSAIQPKTPLEMAASLKAPLLGLYGGEDQSIQQADVQRAAAAAKAAGATVEIVVYADAKHGFHADYRPSYNEADAKAGWSRALQWLKTYGVI